MRYLPFSFEPHKNALKRLLAWSVAVMRKPLLFALVCAAVLDLAGCKDESPVASASYVAEDGRSPERPLSASQVELLNTWLNEHGAGWWQFMLVTPPQPAASLDIRRASGQTATIDFLSQEGWRGTLVIWGQDPSQNRQGSFPPAEVAKLRSQLGDVQ